MQECFCVLSCDRHIRLWIWQKLLNVNGNALTYWELVPGHSCTLPSDFRSLGTADLTKHPVVPQIPEKISIHLSPESAWYFLSLAYWKRLHFSLEFRVIFSGETTCHLFSRRRDTLTWSCNSFSQSQMKIDVRQEVVCLSCPRSLPLSTRRQGLVVFGRVWPIALILSMNKHVEWTNWKAFHSSHMQHLWILSTRHRF